MLDAAQDLPDDVAELQAMVRASRVELRARDLLIEKLRYQLEGLRRHRFGARSETLDQLELTLEDAEIAQALEKGAAEAPTPDIADAPANAKRHPVRRPLPDHLARNEQTLSPGEACGRCGGKLKTLGEDVTEELEFVPGRFVVNRIVRPRMVCGCCETFHQAPLPSRPIERGRPGPGPARPCAGIEVRGSPCATNTPTAMEVWNCVRDEGRPLGACDQVPAPNHRELLS